MTVCQSVYLSHMWIYYSDFEIIWFRLSVVESTETVNFLFVSVNTNYVGHEAYKITASFLRSYSLHWIAVGLNNIKFVVNSNWKIPFAVNFIMMKVFWDMALCLTLIFRLFRTCLLLSPSQQAKKSKVNGRNLCIL